jgi:HPt (histidine-containing phosphotransfer) domain-containing protein
MTTNVLANGDSANVQDQPIMDYAQAITRVGGDAELLKELGGLFLEEYPRLLAQLRDAHQHGEAVQLEHAAHALKGAVSNFGAKAAVELAAQIEQLGSRGNLDSTAAILQSLELVLLSLHGELARL